MYPQSNSARSVRDLSGVWDFRFNANEPWQPIAVPASYNDQSPDPEFRRHYGMAYYRTTFTVPEGARRVLRFDAVTHNAVVRLNGQEIASHRGGFLPFEADITALAQPGETVTLEDAAREGEALLRPLDSLFRAYPAFTIPNAALEKKCLCGNPLRVSLADGIYRVYGCDGTFLALSEARDGLLTSKRNFFSV